MKFNNLKSLFFRGDLLWVYNEEGSGAKHYKSSAYYPDSLTDPQTQSGVTIDPGLDLGSADRNLIMEVINLYHREGCLHPSQMELLKMAIGKKRFDAIEWINKYRSEFKNEFLVPEELAVYVMDNITAPDYWEPIASGLPDLLKIEEDYLAKAIHTALLSYAYNRGWSRTIVIFKEICEKKDWVYAAATISNTQHKLKALNDRRKRESELIFDALYHQEKFVVSFQHINPKPLTTIPVSLKDSVYHYLEAEMYLRDVPEKPEITL
jgi:hypothetical protein